VSHSLFEAAGARGRGSATTTWTRCAFTLIELLVVIVIIGLLVALLLPALAIARERGRQAKCKGNLHQFAVAVDIYRNDYGDVYPPWLSTLYPTYMSLAEVYQCPSDTTRGDQGGMPAWFSDPKHNASQYVETDDMEAGDSSLDPLSGEFLTHAQAQRATRNTEIKRSSYMYEFGFVPCSWWYNDDGDWENDSTDYTANKDLDSKKWADWDENGFVSWREAKRTEQMGLEWDSGQSKYITNDDEIYGGWVPMVRCFWHADRDGTLANEMALNLACETKNIYDSTIFGKGWKEKAGR